MLKDAMVDTQTNLKTLLEIDLQSVTGEYQDLEGYGCGQKSVTFARVCFITWQLTINK